VLCRLHSVESYSWGLSALERKCTHTVRAYEQNREWHWAAQKVPYKKSSEFRKLHRW